MRQLASIQNGNCSGNCKTVWMRNLKYALQTKSNPLKLTTEQRKTMKAKIKELSKKGSIKQSGTKYTTRKSPPFPANDYCGKKMKGNDGNMYESKPNKNNVCAWKKV